MHKGMNWRGSACDRRVCCVALPGALPATPFTRDSGCGAVRSGGRRVSSGGCSGDAAT